MPSYVSLNVNIIKPMKKLLFGSIENSNSADLTLALFRVFIGLSLMLAHGVGKIPVSDGFVEHIGSLGFPMPMFFAWAAALSEFLGALLLALGLFTRPAALMVASTMFVAAFINHGEDPFAAAEKAYLYCSIALMFTILGSGRFGIDSVIRRKLNI